MKRFFGIIPLALFAIATMVAPVYGQHEEGEGKSSQEDKPVSVQVEGNKVIIKLADGEQKIIDLTELKNEGKGKRSRHEAIFTKAQDVDDEKHVDAIIVDRDGNKEVIRLRNVDPAIRGTFRFEGKDGAGDSAGEVIQLHGLADVQLLPGVQDGTTDATVQWIAEVDPGKYMIGVSCEEVPAALRAHLKLDDGKGLLVTDTFEDTPAFDVLKDHDVILKVNGESVSSLQDLISAVQESGDNSKVVTLVVLREGDDMRVEVTPIERKTDNPQVVWHGKANPEIRVRLQDVTEGKEKEHTHRLQLSQPRSGLILPRRSGGDDQINLAEQIAELRRQIEELKEAINDK